MKIVAFLQNQWFKNPERHKGFAERYPQLREEMIRRFLFSGCKTGRILKASLGESLCKQIIWEETSREVGGHSSSIFPPDYEHINGVCLKHNPDIIVAFGKQASEALTKRDGFEFLFCGPHPANRRDGTREELCDLRERIERLVKMYQAGHRGEELEALTKRTISA